MLQLHRHAPRGVWQLASILLGLGAATPALAQEPTHLRGRVVTALDGRPVPGARVELLERHLVETTHADGGFAFPQVTSGSWELSISAIGYRSAVVTVEVVPGRPPLVVRLEASALELEPIVVTGTIAARPGVDVLSPSAVLRDAELARRQDLTVAATIAAEPGVSVTSTGPATARPVIRGLGGDRIVILEDGTRPGDLSSTSSDHAVAIDGVTAGQVDIVRGPMSLLYGSSALGGVVNVVRDEVPRSRPEHAHGELRAQGATASPGAALGGWLTGAAGPAAYRIEASARGWDDTRTPEGTLSNTGGNTSQVAAGAALVGASGHAGAAYRYYRNDYGIPGGYVGGHPLGVDIAMRRHTARVDAERHPAGGAFDLLRASAMFTHYTHRELEASGHVGTSYDQDVLVSDLAARHGAFGPANLGALGARIQYRDIATGGSLRTPSTWDLGLAGYLVEEIPVGPVRLQAGLRYDWARYEPRDTSAFIVVGGERVPVRPRTFGNVSASLGGLAEVAEGLRVGVNLARAYRTPDFNELYSNGPHLAANSYDVGDPALDAETGLGLDAFVRVDRDRLSGEVSAFANWMRDYIFPSSRGRVELGSQGGVPRFQYSNEDARFVGAEGRLSVRVAERWVVEGTASWVAATFTSDLAPIPVISAGDTTFIAASMYPPLIPPLHGSVEARYETPGFEAGLATRWAARQDRTGDFESQTAGYGLLDAFVGARFTLAGRLHGVTLRADNLLDKSYRDHMSRLKDTVPMPGRGLTLNYRVTF